MIVFEKNYAWAILIHNLMMLTYQKNCLPNFSATGHQISLIFDMLIHLGMLMIVFEKDYAWAYLIHNLMMPIYQKTCFTNFSANVDRSPDFINIWYANTLRDADDSFWKKLCFSNSYL